MRLTVFGLAAAFGGLVLLSPAPASARFPAQPIAAPILIEDVDCRVRRVRTVRPNGRVIYKTVRTCTPGYQDRSWRDCRNIRKRVVRPNGRVVYKNIRRCG